MGTIQKRAGKKGTSYTATIRLKSYPTITETFTSKTEAKLWVSKTEKEMKQGRRVVLTEF